MEWWAGATGLIAGAITVPLLVLMYFLKLRRRDVLVSSTLLWKRAVQDLQVNAPFQRLRRNLLLLLQLLALLLVLVALARPILSVTGGQGGRIVILIDRSASMSATDTEPARLELAKREARKIVESLRGGAAFGLAGGGDQAMVITFSDRAKVMCNFTSDKHRLMRAIESITPTDGGSALSEAITVARAFAQSPGEDANNRTATARAQLELFSDGRIRDIGQLVMNEGELRFHRIGKSAGGNVAVVAMQARRSYENAAEVNVFASLANYDASPAECDVQLSVDGNVRSVRGLSVPGCELGPAGEVAKPGRASISFRLAHAGSGVVEVRQLRPDALARDDAAWAVLQPPRKLTALLVTRGNPVLSAAMKSCPLAGLDVKTPAQFDAMDHSAMTVQQPYDVIVLDDHAPGKLPRGRFVVFGRPPPDIGVAVPGRARNQGIVDWRGRHPVLQYLNLTNLFAAQCHRLKLPRDAVVLADFNETPAMALVSRKGSTFLLVGFDVLESNWPFEPSFVMFCYNAMKYLGMELGRTGESSLKVGQAIEVMGEASASPAEVKDPGGKVTKVAWDSSGMLRYPRTYRVGTYTVSARGRPVARFAVNLLDENESNIEPRDELVLSGQKLKAEAGPVRRTNQELWPLLAAVALAMVCLEWFVYNSRVRL